MHIPDSLAPLFETGTIERVVRPLMSGKEAQVYLVMAHGELCVAKVYKEAQNRSFRNRAAYTEGRKTRNSRDQRAIDKRTQHGRAQDEAAWKSTEVDMIRRLHAGGVRVPVPYAFLDGVLVMECVVDAEGNPAPRLGEISIPPDLARTVYDRVLAEVVRMLSLGIVHGDLSPFNILLGADGPVLIDFPQSVDAAGNTNARRILLRDVENMHRFLAASVPGSFRRPYAEEMWSLYEQAALTAETRLTGKFVARERRTSDESVLGLVREAAWDERRRRESFGGRGGARPAPRNAPPPVYESKRAGSAMKLTPREPPPGQRPPEPAARGEHEPHRRPEHGPQRRPDPASHAGGRTPHPHGRAPYSAGRAPHPEQRHPEQRHPEQRHPEQRHPEQRHPEQRHSPHPEHRRPAHPEQPRGPRPEQGRSHHPAGPRPPHPHGQPRPTHSDRRDARPEPPRPNEPRAPRPETPRSARPSDHERAQEAQEPSRGQPQRPRRGPPVVPTIIRRRGP